MRKQWQIISLSLRDLTATSDIRKRVFMWLLSVNESESSMWHRRTPLELDSTMRVHTYTNTMHTWPTEFWLLLIVKWCFSIQCCSWGNFAPNFNRKWCWMCIRDWITTQSIDSSTDRLLVVPRIHTKLARYTFSVAAPSTWNSPTVDIQLCENIPTFKHHLKTHLFKLVSRFSSLHHSSGTLCRPASLIWDARHLRALPEGASFCHVIILTFSHLCSPDFIL